MNGPTSTPIEGAPREELEHRLAEIEREHQVRIFFACESGSRAWGFPSVDSDYDVRFLYARPTDWYLSIDIESRRDVIETPLEGLWDLNGWDVRKALQLFKKSNGPLFEWLGSPIVYRAHEPATSTLRALVPRFFNPVASWFHYLHMAKGTHRDHLAGDRVKAKKVFYALRPLLACRWIERDLGVVPTAFGELVDATLHDPDGGHLEVREAIEALIARKRAAEELGEIERVGVLGAFIDEELARLEAIKPSQPPPQTPAEELSIGFRAILETLAVG